MKKEAAEVKKREPVRRKQTLRALYLQLLAVLGGVIGTVLHRMVLQYGMDEKERIIMENTAEDIRKARERPETLLIIL